MPLLLLLPLLIAGVFALWVVLLPVSIVQRYRLGRARRRVQPWVVGANAWLMLPSTAVFVLTAWAMDQWVADALRDAVAGLGLGAGAGMLGLWTDRFESTPQGVFRTPNRWLLLALTSLLALRIVLGLALAWHGAAADSGWPAWINRGGLLGVAGILIGYALVTTWGLRARTRRHALNH